MDLLEGNGIRMFGAFFHHLEETMHLVVVESGLLWSGVVLYRLRVPVDVEHLHGENTVLGFFISKRRSLRVQLSQHAMHIVPVLEYQAVSSEHFSLSLSELFHHFSRFNVCVEFNLHGLAKRDHLLVQSGRHCN